MLAFPPLLCRQRYRTGIYQDTNDVTHIADETPSGVQIGPIRVPVANNYDVDNEYNYIMNKALRSYRLHREKERAENRQIQLKTAYRRRWRAPSVPSKVRNCMSAPPTRAERAPSPAPSATDAIKEVGDANDPNDGNKGKKVIPVEVKRVTLSMDDSLSPKAQSYLRRNKSTHAWQSHSFPSANYLSQHVRQQFQQIAQARNDVVPAAGKSSTSNERPSSAMNYSYDGGIFLPHKAKHDYFVIHPDWVSESMTIQKLSLKDRKKKKTDTWPGRRCKSAPPPNERNIITWNNGESV
ncbi:hypothetical protein FSP39_008057 [Pinctada imbricata]|uniref:Uncharacterized protein n=1 Tax=Pinctada imbricata TaxID=66713 RepID=A0AA88YHX3_PINIB|nr:hypothetical protein FSP39_008057 [Pinctada imbricata]